MLGFSYMKKIKKISAKDIAEQLGIDKTQISHWERGTRRIPAKHKDSLSKILDIDPEWLDMDLTSDQMRMLDELAETQKQNSAKKNNTNRVREDEYEEAFNEKKARIQDIELLLYGCGEELKYVELLLDFLDDLEGEKMIQLLLAAAEMSRYGKCSTVVVDGVTKNKAKIISDVINL